MTQKTFKTHYVRLRKRWTKKHKDIQKELWTKHKDSLDWVQKQSKHAMFGSVAGLLMMSQPAVASVIPADIGPTPTKPQEINLADAKTMMMNKLHVYLPTEVQPLTAEQETLIAQTLSDSFKLKVVPELEGKRLNRTYGIIGAEQHLMRYPGDTMDTHFATNEEAATARSGMAPGRGAWGYFAPSAAQMTQKDVDREKYYIAAQTFLAPGWSEDHNSLYQFFKYRKMLMVNPDNGKAMVVVIGDAGPAPFTGKHLGGSPEVMKYMERQDGGARGPVLYFFIDDPDDTVPLGPITL